MMLVLVVPIHLAFLALFMYLYARHEADYSPYRILLFFGLPVQILVIATSLVGLVTIPLYFVIVFFFLKLWFYVGWRQSATISGSFCAYLVVGYFIFQNVTAFPEEEAYPKSDFIATADEHRPFRDVRLLVDHQSGMLSCQLVVDQYTAYDSFESDPEIRSGPGWFVYCEYRNSYWIYSGFEEFVHIEIPEDSSEVVVKSSSSDSQLLNRIPSPVLGRLKKQATIPGLETRWELSPPRRVNGAVQIKYTVYFLNGSDSEVSLPAYVDGDQPQMPGVQVATSFNRGRLLQRFCKSPEDYGGDRDPSTGDAPSQSLQPGEEKAFEFVFPTRESHLKRILHLEVPEGFPSPKPAKAPKGRRGRNQPR